LGGLDAIRSFRKLVKQADVVHYLFPWPFADILHALAPKKPSVLTYVSDVVRQEFINTAYSPLMHHTLKGMQAIVANAPGYIESSPVLRELAVRSKIKQIPLGIVQSSYSTKPDQGVFKRLNIISSEPFILFVGVLRYYKGLHTLIEACIQTKGLVVIVGDGPERAVLQAKAAQLGLKNIIFTGRVTDNEKIALLESCRAFVLPSHLRSEAYGMVLVEASMYGKPMVTCEIGTGTSYINIHDQTGLVVAPESPTELANAMNMMIADNVLAQRLGLKAKARYDEIFSGKLTGQAYKDLFQKVMQ
jgi:rhamnosyl/mannosyltransferase